LLARWNCRVNLVSRKEGMDGILSHILQSLAAHSLLALPDSASYFDLGTGGGFPGIPLAVIMPSASFVLCDSIGKKIRAVEDMTSALGLSNVRCLHARAEDAGTRPEHQGAYDIVLSRAVAALNEVARLCLPLLRREGPRPQIAWKGGDISRELNGLKRLQKVESAAGTALALEWGAE